MKFGLFYELQLPKPLDSDSGTRTPSTASTTRCSTRSSSPTSSASTTSSRSSTTSSRSTRTPRRRRSCSRPPASARRTSASATASCSRRRPTTTPARVAERISALDLVSQRPRRVRHRRVVLGHGARRLRRRPGTRRRRCGKRRRASLCDMMSETPYPGFEGEYFTMPRAQRHPEAAAEAAPAAVGRRRPPRDR